MNKVILCGRLTKDPDVRVTQGAEPMTIARYALAVDRMSKKENAQTADFISCVAFGKQGEFAEKFLAKGMKILIEGRIQTGSYTDKDGTNHYTTDVVVERHEFVDSKADKTATPTASQTDNNGFMQIPEGADIDELPFN